LSSHSGKVKVKLCVIITSDAVAYGTKEDYVEECLRRSLEKCTDVELMLVAKVPNSLPIIINEIRKMHSLCNAILITGGTGLSASDLTSKALEMISGEPLVGVGEYLRVKSYDAVGSRAAFSRCYAKLVRYPRPLIMISTPGARDAVELAVNRLICSALPHALYEASKESPW